MSATLLTERLTVPINQNARSLVNVNNGITGKIYSVPNECVVRGEKFIKSEYWNKDLSNGIFVSPCGLPYDSRDEYADFSND